MTYEAEPNKSGRIEAVHQFVNQNEQLCVHLDTRQTGNPGAPVVVARDAIVPVTEGE